MIENLIKELNSLVPYGIEITNSITEAEDIDFENCINKKSIRWKVRSYINENFESPSISTYNEDLKLALEENIKECKGIFNK